MKYKQCFSIILLLIQIGYAQNDVKNKYDNIIENSLLTNRDKIREIEHLIEVNKTIIQPLIEAKVYHDLSKKIYKEDVDKAIGYANRALEIRTKYKDRNSIKLSLYVLARYHYAKGTHLKALKYCDELLTLCTDNEIRRAKVNWLKAKIYTDKGDYQKALNCYVISEFIYKKHKEYKSLVSIYKNTLAVYAEINDEKYKEDFFITYNKIQELSKKIDIPTEDLIDFKINLGNFYDTLKDYNSSIKNYTEALKLSVEINDSLSIAKNYNNLGIANKKIKNIPKAFNYLEKALEHSKSYATQKAHAYDNLGDLYKIQENYELAISYYQKAIDVALGVNQEVNTMSTYLNSIKWTSNKIEVLGYIVDQAYAWMEYGITLNNSDYLKKALSIIELVDKEIDVIYFESRESLSKLFWRGKGADLYLKAVNICYELNQPKKAFYFIEKGKAFMLLENVTNLNAKILANLPDEIIEEEFKLLKSIDDVKYEYVDKQNLSVLEKENLENKIIYAKEKYSKFIDSLEIQYPKYHNYKKRVEVYSANKTQKNIKNEQLVLQYKITDKQAYVSLISKEHIKIFEIEEAVVLKKRILQFQKLLKKPFVNKEDEVKYRALAFSLYKQLFPFVEEYSQLIKNKELLIIQDGILLNIPFEPLITENTTESLDKLFLINDFNISYAFSFSSLMSGHKIEKKCANDFLAMSPTYFKNKSLSPLIIYKEEKKALENIMQTSMLTNEKATKEIFKKAYGDYKVIHLSTHGGGSQEEKPWLAFYDDVLELNEIYFTDQYTDLVVLSACKTSQGELKKGEGIMSVARGFVNAGAKSVLATHWDVDQKSNNEIIYSFYSYLKESKTKTEALRNAKLDYISKYKNTSEISPYYWSALTLTGNEETIFENNYKWYYFLLLLIPAGVLFRTIKLKNRTRSNKKVA